jgi:RHS repeat-associated protein
VVDPALPQGEPCPTLPAAGSGSCLPTHLAYDAYGNLLETVDANGNLSTTRYDATNIYPAAVIDVNGFQVATVYDAACGALRSETIRHAHTEDPAAQPASTYQYDSFCRLQRLALPDESPLTPHAQYYYFLGAPQQASDVLIRSVEPWAASGVVLRDVLFDGLGRHLQTQRPTVVDGTTAMVTEHTVAYDARGQIGQRFVPFLATQRFRGGAALYSQPPAGTGVTTVQYDPLNRIVDVLAPDQSRRTMTYDVAGQTTTKDECYLASGCTGAMTVERRDVLGQLEEVQRFDESGTLLARTAYTFDSRGHLHITQQGDAAGLNAATKVVHEYDSLGRKTGLEDPDSGRWRYGYDRIGNLVYQDDPKPGQHVEFCYDAGGRVLRKRSIATGDAYEAVGCEAPGTVTYTYDDPAVPNGSGRLTRVDDESGSTLWQAFDVRGHPLVIEKQVRDLNGTLASATTRFQYDAADHLTAITYPDDETVRYGYDAAGQVRSLRSTAAAATTYLTNLTYDVFGRPRVVTHGNGTTAARTYADSGRNFRLASLTTRQSSGTALLNLSYAAYTPTGLLTRIADLRDASSVLSNTATFTYDGLGRLSAVTGSPVSNPAFAYDAIGNLTRLHDATVRYADTLRPHQATSVSSWTGIGGAITHDANGNRVSKPGQAYTYDRDDRLQSVRAGNTLVSFFHDHAGRAVLQHSGPSVVRYFNPWAEERDGYLVKHYFAAGMRIASQRVWMPQLATAAPPAGLAVAATSPPRHGTVADGRLRTGVLFAVGLLATALFVAPWRRQPVAGLAVRHGHVVAVILAFTVSTLPWRIPGLPPPAAAAQTTPTLWHYHLDHLGSTQVLTDAAGALLQQIRYAPYGAVRYRSAASPNRYEFAGYETEWSSGLQHAGSRVYDPALGMFLTQDPAHQFPNPYTYAGWSPTNLSDPDGEFVIELLAWVAVAAVMSAAVNSVIAAAQGASLRQIGEAAVSGAATGAVGVGLGVLAGGASIGLAGLAGTLPHDVTVRTAINALGEVAHRAAFSTVVANAAAQTSGAAGAPPALSAGLAVAAGIGGSVAFDSYFADYSADLARVEGRAMFRRVSNTITHSNVTTKAAEVAGFSESEAGVLLKHNLAQDLEVANNQHHFGFGAQGAFKRLADVAVKTRDIRYVGAASHYLQDQYALGHIFPGTHLFSAAVGAPFRFIIHQTVGGEVNFFRLIGGLRIPVSFDASVEYFSAARDYIPAGTPL